MKLRIWSYGIVAIILALLPMVFLAVNPQLLWNHYKEIVAGCGSLVGFAILFVLLGGDDFVVRVTQVTSLTGKDKKIITDYNTVPLICTMFILEMVIVFIVNPLFIEKNITFFTTTISSIVGAWFIYGILGGDAKLIHTYQAKGL